jgi:uncharacterized membrane protein
VEELLVSAVGYMRLVVEAIGAAVIGIGTVSTVLLFARFPFAPGEYSTSDIRLHLGRFLVLGLEFQLAADVLATAIAPTWEAVRLLAAIVVIRTVLNYFLSKELERGQAPPRLGRDDSSA